MMMFLLCTLGLVEIALPQVQKERERKVHADKQQFQEQDFWIYDNLEVAFEVAAEKRFVEDAAADAAAEARF